MTYTQAITKMKTHKPGTPEHTEAWQQAENAKNQNGGMPPSGHTPGPWEAVQLTPSHWTSPEWAITGPRQGIGADLIGHCYRQRDNAEANARLIAAAPELLAALDECLAWFDLDPHRSHPIMAQDTEIGFRMIQAIRAAIAKAKGQ